MAARETQTQDGGRRPRARLDGRAADNGTVEIKKKDLQELLDALRAARDGEVGMRLSAQKSGVMGDVAKAFNGLAERREGLTDELGRVSKVIGREGRMTERAKLKNAKGSWADSVDSVNSMIDDLVRPTIEVSRVLDAVAEGDLSQKMSLKIEGQPVRGEFLRIGTTVNTMVDQLSSFASEVTRVAREVGTEGMLGGQARVKDVSGIWRDLTDNVNFMANNLTTQVRNIAEVTTAVANGDLSQEDHRRRQGRSARAQEHDQHDGRPAGLVRRRGDARRARSRHRRQARRPGDGQGRQRHLEGPDRQRQLHGDEPDDAGARHREGRDARSRTATSTRSSRSRRRARSLRSPTRSTR